MLGILIEKELKSIIQSPKFVATFAVCSILILLSVLIGLQEYRSSVAQYEIATELVNQEMAEATSWKGVNTKVYRAPNPMQIFVSGVNYDVGRLSHIQFEREVKLQQSAYSDDPLFAVFRYIDFGFIVQVVLSLFAIVFTYDAINGERESGTLKLVLSNAVPRAQYLLAKLAGAWLGLTIPLLIPILLGVLLVMLFRVPMTGADWMKLTALIGLSILYFTFFIALSLLVSSLTRSSSVSFLVLLVAWIALVLIVPRGATMAAGQLVDVPTVAQTESQKDRFRTDRQSELDDVRHQMWMDQMRTPTQGMSDEDRRAYFNANRAALQEQINDMQSEVESVIGEYNRKVNEDLRNAKLEQERVAFLLSRLSPASAYKLTAMNLGGTNTAIKQRNEDQMAGYRETYKTYVTMKSEEEDSKRRAAAQSSGNRRMWWLSSGSESIDSTGMPKFIASGEPAGEVIKASILDFGLLTVFTLLAFAGAFVAFVRYDVR